MASILPRLHVSGTVLDTDHYIAGRIEPPEVAYSDHGEFLELQRVFIQDYIQLINSVFIAAFDQPCAHSQLIWTERDMILHGVANFPTLSREGANLIYRMTKSTKRVWCVVTGLWLGEMVTAGCRGHARALMSMDFDRECMHEIYRQSLRNEMIATLYDNLHVFDDLYNACFVTVATECPYVKTAYTMMQWRDMQVAFCMLTHLRLGRDSLFRNVDTCIIQFMFQLTLQRGTDSIQRPASWD